MKQKYKIPRLKNKTEGLLNFIEYKHKKNKVVYGLIVIVILISAIICLLPFIWLFFSGFKTPQELVINSSALFPESFKLSKIALVWKELEIGKLFRNSLVSTLGCVICSIIFNGLLAYSLAILKPKGYKVVYVMILSTLMIPAITNMATLIIEIKEFNLFGSYIPIWLSYGANAFYFVLFYTYFNKLPKELFEAAQIDGANRIQMFSRIVFPLSLPIMSVVAIFTTTASWSDFLLPYLVLDATTEKQTLMLRIYKIASSGSAEGMTQDKILLLITIAILPVIIIFLIFQKKIQNNAVSTGMKD